jgi:hypothetical protein
MLLEAAPLTTRYGAFKVIAHQLDDSLTLDLSTSQNAHVLALAIVSSRPAATTGVAASPAERCGKTRGMADDH